VATAFRDLGAIARIRANAKLLSVVEGSWDRMGLGLRPS
jgi:hypothetical protein